MTFEDLFKKIENKEAKICIVGMGYVGIPLALAFIKAGFEVHGYDIDNQKINKLKDGKSYINNIEDEKIKEAIDTKRFYPTVSTDEFPNMDVFIICVPTPIDEYRNPNLSYINSAIDGVTSAFSGYLFTKGDFSYFKRDKTIEGKLFILESTSYPGTTREVLLEKLKNDMGMPLIQEKNMSYVPIKTLKVGKDFFVGYSPEREDPGNKEFGLKNTPKVVSGITKDCLSLVSALYSSICEKVVEVSTTDTAEATKLLENTFRTINIAFINEMKVICDGLGIDIWEVIEAAKTKPFGFMPFYPGAGIGGECLPCDPFYLSHKAKTVDINAHFIELSGEVNARMAFFITEKIQNALNEEKKPIKHAKILVLGITYKKDSNDLRESPSLRVIKCLQKLEANVSFYDQNVDFNIPGIGCLKELNEKVVKSRDCILVLVDHSNVDYELISEHAKLIVDTRNIIKKAKGRVDKA